REVPRGLSAACIPQGPRLGRQGRPPPRPAAHACKSLQAVDQGAPEAPRRETTASRRRLTSVLRFARGVRQRAVPLQGGSRGNDEDMTPIETTVARLTALHPKRIDLSLDRMWRILA